jgi:hypothetical protein
MGLTKLAAKCRKCPYLENCDHKQFEAEAYFADPNVDSAAESSVAELARPILRETVDIIVDGKAVKIYKDDLARKIYESLYCDSGLQYGLQKDS